MAKFYDIAELKRQQQQTLEETAPQSNNILDLIKRMFIETQYGGASQQTNDIIGNLGGGFDLGKFLESIITGEDNSLTQATEGRINQSFDKASLGQRQRLAGTGLSRSGLGSIGDLGLEAERGRTLAGNKANSIQGAIQALLSKQGLDQNLIATLLGSKANTDQINESNEFDFGDLLGGVLDAGGSLGSAAIQASDRNLKENIKYTGRSKEGYPITEFNYKGDSKRYRGVIAQDIEEIRPSAVIEVDGIKKVDYSQLDVKFEEI